MTEQILICLLAYLAGSINFAIIFFKLTGRTDPRRTFSGNAGTTNVYRQAGIAWAAFIFLLDIGRAIAVALLAVQYLSAAAVPGAGLFLVLGNSFPCFHNFRGGKGVANYLGFTAVFSPWGATLAALSWVVVYGMVRIPFIASFIMVFILAASAVYLTLSVITVIAAVLTFALIVFNHRKNIINYQEDNKIKQSN